MKKQLPLATRMIQMVELINDNGGVNILKLRFALDEIDKAAADGYELAIRFKAEFAIVEGLVKRVCEDE